MNIEKHDVYKVFTPTTPARLTFVEREKVNSKLVNALRTPGKQVVVYGHSGSGKTTLLVNKLHQLYDSHVTSRCMKSVSFDMLILDAFDQLAPFYISAISDKKTTTLNTQLSTEYLTIKGQLAYSNASETQTKQQRILPPQLTPQALGRFMGASGCCWVLEDFHKIDDKERAHLSQIMKVFMDMADEYPTLKIIALGAVDTARQIVEYDSEMSNRVAEIHVPLMDEDEVNDIIFKGTSLLKIAIADSLAKGISSYSNGMASVCHHLCLNICTSQGIYETVDSVVNIEDQSLQSALQMYLEETSDTLKKAFDIVFKQKRTKKYDNAKLIIKALSELHPDGVLRSEIYEQIRKNEPEYPQGNLSIFLKRLCDDSESPIIRYDADSNKYAFKDPVYRVFALVYFKINSPKKFNRGTNIESIENNLQQVIDEMTKSLKITLSIRQG
ncbi:ATP-binding protein [Aeromonas allosaccharophila]|uniref:ATP-binding protein n=1 Tax=Aeromonas allosaccharophila TaxID=656 RepID=UPI003D21E8EE